MSTTHDLDQKLAVLFESILGLPREAFHDEASTDNTPGWESVAHLNLVMGIEETFGISLTPEDTMEMTSVRLIKMVLQEKLGE
ncbi:acyl carrier protein [Prosthecobacter sp.]|uniref:acyl carrier protein n=1 Tax=Prosthecobacter sp. TaxID=1965333 RepID=UPI003784DE50